MADNLNVNVTATISDLERGMKKAGKQVQGFEQTTERLGKSTTKLGKSVTRGAVPAMTSFSQVIQDAPFGIRGVANNITQLTMQFGHLTANAGGSQNALKAMLKTLAGPAGILLIVSAVTSILVSFGDELFKTKDKAKLLKEENERLATAVNDYLEGLEAVTKGQLKGAKSAQTQLTRLALLKRQIEDTTLAEDKRKKAITEIRKEFPDYFRGLSDEKILLEGLGEAYKLLTTDILKNAKAKALAGAITSNAKKQLTLETQLIELAKENAKVTIRLEKAKADVLNGNLVDRKLGEEAILRLSGDHSEALEKQFGIQKDIVKLQQESERLAQRILDLGGILPLETDLLTKAEKKAFDARVKANKAGIGDVENFVGTISKLYSEADLTITPIQNFQPLIPNSAVVDTKRNLDIIETDMNNFSDSIRGLIAGNLADSFVGFGQLIGTALSGAGNITKSLGDRLLGFFAGLLTEFGTLLITLGTGIVIADIAFKSGNGYAAIAAGVAMVALGALFSAKKSEGINMGRSGSGGSSVSGGSGGSGSRGGTSYSGTSGGGLVGGGGTYVFEIEGTKLVGVLSNTLSRNRALGGSLSLT